MIFIFFVLIFFKFPFHIYVYMYVSSCLRLSSWLCVWVSSNALFPPSPSLRMIKGGRRGRVYKKKIGKNKEKR